MVSNWLLPPDATKEEKDIADYCILQVYDKFDDPIDKLIIMSVFENGYSQRFAAELVGRREQAISLRVKKIRTILSQTHKSFLKTDARS